MQQCQDSRIWGYVIHLFWVWDLDFGMLLFFQRAPLPGFLRFSQAESRKVEAGFQGLGEY